MKKLMKFGEYATPKDLRKIYLIPHSDRFSFSHIDHLVRRVAENLFDLVMAPGIFKDSINSELPVYNYGNHDEIYDLIESGVFKKKNIYNHPDNLKYANDKIEFHKAMDGLDFVPNTVFKQEDVSKLKFPIIAKPKDGSKGEGITVFKTKEELDSFKPEDEEFKLDLFSEKFDLKREFRVITVNGKRVYIAERIPINEKAKSLRESANIFPSKDLFGKKGTLDGRSSYKWVEIKNSDLDDKVWKQMESIMPTVCEKLKLQVMGLDFGLDSKGKVWIIEANTCPGLNKDQIVRIYLEIFEDFYGRKPDEVTMKKIKQMRDELVRASKSKVKFSHSASMGRRMDWTYKEDGRKTSNVKFDVEKSFGQTLNSIKDRAKKKKI
jgi:hypothetical protein